MLPVLTLLALTSTAWSRQVYVPDDYEEREPAREEPEEIDEERAARLERWYSERDFHFVARAGVRAGYTHTIYDEASVELSFGFSQRIAQRYALQGSITFGTGMATVTRDQHVLQDPQPLFDLSADVTVRIGSGRAYFGLGPSVRSWRVFDDDEPFRAGGGVVFEVGFLWGEDREMDLLSRQQVGGYEGRDGDFSIFFSQTLAVGWHF